ncbi:MAG: hypothetical protein ACREXX_06505 [Gammaproteobacteria bacterium]
MSFRMNNRALMERVVLEVGLDLGVILRSVFTMPVFMAVLSTAITGRSLEASGQRTAFPCPTAVRPDGARLARPPATMRARRRPSSALGGSSSART